VWRRITVDGTAWRFNRYAERAQGVSQPPTEQTPTPMPTPAPTPTHPDVRPPGRSGR
jgi:uncharacterized protein